MNRTLQVKPAVYPIKGYQNLSEMTKLHLIGSAILDDREEAQITLTRQQKELVDKFSKKKTIIIPKNLGKTNQFAESLKHEEDFH